jgi:energy-converting hydrogenase Eha subunit A
MTRSESPFLAQAFACWNWKCALFSATARSLVYVAAMARSGLRGGLSVVVVEMAYVALTSGLYAGLQQRALGLRSRWLGDAAIVFGVPWVAQGFDWLTHRAVGAPVPGRATLAVWIYGTLSALFHLYVMRRGAFLTGRLGRSLGDDLRRIPRLVAGFALMPLVLASTVPERLARLLGAEIAM